MILLIVLEYYGKKYLLLANIHDYPLKGIIVGSNYGNPYAYNAKVFTGETDIRITDKGTPKKLPSFTLKPFGCGIIQLEYLTLKAKSN